MPTASDPLSAAQAKLLAQSIPWHTGAGWVVVLVLFWRYLAFPITNVVVVAFGMPPLPALPPLSAGDSMALAGIPLVGLVGSKLGG